MQDKFYQIILEKAFESVSIVNENGLIQFVSFNASTKLGYTVEELIGKNSLSLVYEEDREKVIKIIREVIHNPMQSYTIRARYKHKKGHLIHLLSRSINLLENPDINGILNNFWDISEQANAEAKLEESQKNYQILLENTPQAFFLLDTEGKVLFGNEIGKDFILKTWNVRVKEGDILHQFILGENRKRFERNFDKCISGHQVVSQSPVRLSTDELLWFEVIYTPVRNEQDEIVAVAFSSSNITSRKRAEKQLLASEANLKAILNNTAQAFFLINPEYQIITFNTTAEEYAKKFWNKKIDEKESVFNYVLPQNYEQFKHNFDECLKGKTIKSERLLGFESGVQGWFEVLYSPVKSEYQILGVILSLFDITTRKEVEEKLIRNEAWFKSILDNHIQSLFLLNKDYKVLAFNKVAEEYVKTYNQKALFVNDSMLDFTTQQDSFKLHFARSIQGEVIKLEKYLSFETGSRKWFEITYSPIIQPNGKIEQVLIASLDISDRKEAEEKIRQGERLYRLIAENYPNGIVKILDKNFKTIFAEGKAFQQYNLSPENFLHKTIYEIYASEDVGLFEYYYKQTFKGENCTFEYASPRSFYLIHSVPLYNEQNLVDNILVVIQDIGEIKKNQEAIRLLNKELSAKNQELEQQKYHLTIANEKMKMQQENLAYILQQVQALNERLTTQNKSLALREEELSQANAQLLEKQDELQLALEELSDRNFELDQIVYRTSHDIRSPLASIMGLLNIMKLEGIPDVMQDYTQRIEQSVFKLDRFVNSMLNFAKANRSTAKTEAIDLEGLIEKNFENFQYLKNYDKIQKIVEVDGIENTFVSDLLKVEIIFANIISNAIKYMNPNATQSYLKISVQVLEEGAEIIFEDNGIGIRAEYLAKVFDMFFRATDKAEGSGLGLYIVKQTVEKLNGKIDIHSQYGEGTTFRIFLPNIGMIHS